MGERLCPDHALRSGTFEAGAQQQQQRTATGLDSIAVMVRRGRGEEIHGGLGTDEYWYRVVSGAAKCTVVLPGGRRQILDLLLPNDFFGFTPPGGHACTLEALVKDTVVACYPRRRAEELAQTSLQVAREVRKLTFEAVTRLQELQLIMGHATARKKVASFLLKTKERSARQADDRVVLVTSRYDIADYLGLSVETVSRSLTDLKHRGYIALSGPRRVKIVDPHFLEDDERTSETAHPL
jgi:CRP/FNR family transcriptional regulator, nitrogen fixation regulation protein